MGPSSKDDMNTMLDTLLNECCARAYSFNKDTGLGCPLVDDAPGVERFLHIFEVEECQAGMALGRRGLDPTMTKEGYLLPALLDTHSTTYQQADDWERLDWPLGLTHGIQEMHQYTWVDFT